MKRIWRYSSLEGSAISSSGFPPIMNPRAASIPSTIAAITAAQAQADIGYARGVVQVAKQADIILG